MGHKVRQSSLASDFHPGGTDQTILFDVSAPKKDIPIQPGFVYASGMIVVIGQQREQPVFITDEYTVLQLGNVERRPPKTPLNVVEDWDHRWGDGLVGINGDVFQLNVVPEERVRKCDESHVQCGCQHGKCKQSPAASAVAGNRANQSFWFRHAFSPLCLQTVTGPAYGQQETQVVTFWRHFCKMFRRSKLE